MRSHFFFYPPEFSRQAKARIEVEWRAAERQLEVFRSNRQSRTHARKYGLGLDVYLDAAAEDFLWYCLRRLEPFIHEACKLGLDGTWDIDVVQDKVETAREAIILDAYEEQGYRDRVRNPPTIRSGISSPREIIDKTYILPEFLHALWNSEDGRKCKAELAAVAEAQKQEDQESQCLPDENLAQPEITPAERRRQEDLLGVAEVQAPQESKPPSLPIPDSGKTVGAPVGLNLQKIAARFKAELERRFLNVNTFVSEGPPTPAVSAQTARNVLHAKRVKRAMYPPIIERLNFRWNDRDYPIIKAEDFLKD